VKLFISILCPIFYLSLGIAQTVDLEWDASPSTVDGYNLYRSGPDPTFDKRNTEVIPNLTYTDTISCGVDYHYVATAVRTYYPYGDVTRDWVVTVSDAVAVSRHLVGLDVLTGDALVAADANEDDEVTVADIIRIHQHVLEIALLGTAEAESVYSNEIVYTEACP
jgi:hypothetical protein